MPLASVILDSREPPWVQQLTFGNVPLAVTMLDAGDLLAATDDGAMLAVERKTAGDLLNTLREERLFPQIARLREASQFAYLVICGELRPGLGGHCIVDGRESGWTWASVAGALLSVQELGVYVLQVASDYEYEAAVIRLGNRDRAAHRVAPARNVTIVSEQEQILAALPGIGSERAAALLRQFVPPALALQWLTTPEHLWWQCTVHVPGVGEGTKRRVRKALGLTETDEGTSVLEVITYYQDELAAIKEVENDERACG